MWQRFTERARKVVFYAQEEAGRLGDNYVSTEHLLLGLIREPENVAGRILKQLGMTPEKIQAEIDRQVTRGDGRRVGQDFQLTPRAKRVIDLAYDEARQIGNNYIGTEHLLLGLVREGEGLAARVLAKLGVELDQTRQVVIQVQNSGSRGEKTQPAKSGLTGSMSRQPTVIEDVLRSAVSKAAVARQDIGLEHILLAIFDKPDSKAAKALAKLGVTPHLLAQTIAEIDGEQPKG